MNTEDTKQEQKESNVGGSEDSSDLKMQTIINNLQDLNPNRYEDSVNNPNLQKEILELIEKIYFIKSAITDGDDDDDGAVVVVATTNKMNVAEYELRKFQTKLKLSKSEIKNLNFKLQLQLQIVSRKVSDLILANNTKCSQQLQNVTELKSLLERSQNYCLNARYALNSTLNKFTFQSLGLIKNEYKKKQLCGLISAMYTIKSLQKTNLKVKEMIEKEDFPKAIVLCLQCQKAANTYEQYKCIKDLKVKMQSRLDQIEEYLNVAISKQCIKFDKENYLKLINAYELLEKSHTFIDQLNMHFVNSINICSIKTIFNFLIDNYTNLNIEELKRKQYKDLCELVQSKDYENCLKLLCLNLWNIMKNFYEALLVHKDYLEENEITNKFDLNYIIQKFESGKHKLWQDVQIKVNICFRSMNLNDYKFDDFLNILEINNRLMEIGQEFTHFNSDCQILLNAAKDQTLSYFKSYHISRLEELKMFLENEIWVWCPVKASFSMMKLHEFKFLRNSKSTAFLNKSHNMYNNKNNTSNSSANRGTTNGVSPSSSSSSSSSSTLPPPRPPPPGASTNLKLNINDFIKDLFEIENPFNLKNEINKERTRREASIEHEYSTVTSKHGEHYSTDSDEDSYDEDNDTAESADSSKHDSLSDTSSISSLNILKRFIGNGNGHQMEPSNKSNNSTSQINSLPSTMRIPIVTNTTLNVIRLFGKYLHMLNTFEIISIDVINYMMQLFYFYFYYIYINFAKRDIDNNNSIISETLHNILKSVHSELFIQNKYISEPSLSPSIIRKIINRDDYMNCIKERIVAAESLVFLATQLEQLFPYFDNYLTENTSSRSRIYIEQFQIVIKHVNELRAPIYTCIARYAINYSLIYDTISRINWEIDEIMSEHNKYIDVLLHQIKQLIDDVLTLKEFLPLHKQMLNSLIEQCIRIIMRVLVDGYSQARKCTNEGRALMQLDFQQLIVKLEKLYEIRPIPDKDYVETYIKAYYLPEQSFEKWIRDHNEYSSKHVIALINVMSQITRKTKISLINSFTETVVSPPS